MNSIFGILASIAGFYSILIFIRIVVTWFSAGFPSSKPIELLGRITDPYLNWWRNRLNFRLGVIDLSPLFGIAALSVIQRILHSLAASGRVSIGVILAIILVSLWSIIAFILGFCFFIIILRLIGYLTNRNPYSHFWRIIDTISQPLLYRLTRIMFGDKIIGYIKGLLCSALLLGVIWIGGGFVVPLIAAFLKALPL